MNAPKVTDLDYINFLLAAPRVVSCTQAARVQPERPRRAAHDALTYCCNASNRIPRRSGVRPSSMWTATRGS